MNILLVGASGRMGERIQNIKMEGVNIIAGIDKKNDVNICGGCIKIYKNFSELEDYLINKIDIILDFAEPNVLKDELLFAIKNKKKLVICSTGHNESEMKLIEKASRIIPIFKTSNTSYGIALINKIIKDNIPNFADYDVFVFEKHHKNKKDAPSGTAKTIISNFEHFGRGVDYGSARGGSVVGEHEIILLGDGEQICLKHIAENRELFAVGALKICKFMNKQKECRLYFMEDLLENGQKVIN